MRPVGNAELNEGTESSSDLREAVRSNVFLGASLYWERGQSAVRVRNFSERGALLDGKDLPGKGTGAELRRGSLTAKCEIAWASSNLRGVRFERALSVSRWVGKQSDAGQTNVDEAIASIRSGVPAAPFGAGERGNETLDSMALELARICEKLSATPKMTLEFGEELIRLDALTHRLFAASKVYRP
jgi:hypothetical protein